VPFCDCRPERTPAAFVEDLRLSEARPTINVSEAPSFFDGDLEWRQVISAVDLNCGRERKTGARFFSNRNVCRIIVRNARNFAWPLLFNQANGRTN
jgi:hypothetical protein